MFVSRASRPHSLLLSPPLTTAAILPFGLQQVCSSGEPGLPPQDRPRSCPSQFHHLPLGELGAAGQITICHLHYPQDGLDTGCSVHRDDIVKKYLYSITLQMVQVAVEKPDMPMEYICWLVVCCDKTRRPFLLRVYVVVAFLCFV